MVDNEVVACIAKKIRATRLEKKLTIQQLANRTRVSKGLLSKIENMRTVPSLPVFVTLIQSLNVSLKDFFKDLVLTDGKGYQLIRKEHYMGQPDKGQPGINRHHLLLQNINDSTLEVAIVSIAPGDSGKFPSSSGYIFLFVISGSCYVEISDDVVALNEGDVMWFESSADRSFKTEVTAIILQFTFATSR
jgi:transcriptional regulator with XRE-family HTH domain